MDTTRRKRDGDLVHVSLSMSPIRNSFNEATAVSIIYRDITQKVQRPNNINLLMRTVSHRSENLLTVVQGVAPGFGSAALGKMAPQAVRGSGVSSFDEAGLRYELRAATSEVLFVAS